MRLRGNDQNLNQFGGSLKEAMKRTMIQHEIIFRNQVRDLHRVYWIQKSLMGEVYHRDFEAKEQQSQMGLSREGNVGCVEEAKRKFVDFNDNRKRGFDLELPAKDYIGNYGYCSLGDEVTGCSMKDVINVKGSGEEMSLHCYEVIDLEEEEPVEMGSDVEAYRISGDGFMIPLGRGEVRGCFKPNITSDVISLKRARNNSGILSCLDRSHVGCRERWEEREVQHSGRGESESAAAVVDQSIVSTHRQGPSSKPFLIDLNIPQDDEFSDALDDPIVPFPSPSSSSSVVQNEHFWKDQTINGHGKETSDRPLLVSMENSSKVSDIIQKQEHECSEEDTMSSHTVAQEEKQQDQVDANSLPRESTECRSPDKSIDENSGTTQLSNTVYEEEEGTVFYAAMILADLSLGKSINIEIEEDDESEQPQYSLDSFEKMTVELPEIESKEQIMPANQTEKDEGGEVTGTGVSRLRRGRGRVRDFQKDILPGMVSLSRHEICEDIHSIGYELRKNRSRNAGGGNWFLPVRSRRSRRNPIGQWN